MTIISFSNAHKSLNGIPVLKGVNLDIARGETLAIVGPSGTGKSVLLRHIVGLHILDSGTLTVDGVDTTTTGLKQMNQLRRRIGYLFQSGALIAWLSVFDNVALPLLEYSRYTISRRELGVRVRDVLELVGLEAHADKRPDEISGGMRKRAGLARAIITRPDIILYDEPTSGLDPVMSRRIDALIRELEQKLRITSILVTHDMVSAFTTASRIAMIHNGVIRCCAPTEEFRQSTDPVIRQFIDAQFAPIPNLSVSSATLFKEPVNGY